MKNEELLIFQFLSNKERCLEKSCKLFSGAPLLIWIDFDPNMDK